METGSPGSAVSYMCASLCVALPGSSGGSSQDRSQVIRRRDPPTPPLPSPSPLPSDKRAEDNCRGSSCGSPALHPRWLCAQTASQVSPRCTRSYTLLSGGPRRRSAAPRRSHQTDAGPGTSAGTGLWCAGLLGSCWALPPCSAPRRCSRCCKTPAPHCHTEGRKAREKLRRLTARRWAGLSRR